MIDQLSTTSSGSMAASRLACAIARIARSDGDHATAIGPLSLHRRSAPTAPLHCIYGLGLGLVAQGAKQVLLGHEVIGYAPGQSMLTTVDAPVIAHVAKASPREPFLGLFLALDAGLVTQLASGLQLPPPARDRAPRAISVEAADAALLDALLRLVELLDTPALIPALAPLFQQEVTIRLLVGAHGTGLQHLVATGSPSQQIANAVAWLKRHFREPIQMEQLAASAHMSPSTFRQHFRAITGTSPLQFQKQLRLQEARQLMLNQDVDAGSAAGQVGYESPSQFSREYSRLFGQPPQRDVRRLRPS